MIKCGALYQGHRCGALYQGHRIKISGADRYLILVGLFTSLGRSQRDYHPYGGSYWGTVSSGAFGELHQESNLTRSPQVLPQPFACLPGSIWESEEVGEETRSQVRTTKNVMVCVRVGKRISGAWGRMRGE